MRRTEQREEKDREEENRREEKIREVENEEERKEEKRWTLFDVNYLRRLRGLQLARIYRSSFIWFYLRPDRFL